MRDPTPPFKCEHLGCDATLVVGLKKGMVYKPEVHVWVPVWKCPVCGHIEYPSTAADLEEWSRQWLAQQRKE
jgi:hypothetical protein